MGADFTRRDLEWRSSDSREHSWWMGLSRGKLYIKYTEQKHSCLGMVPAHWHQIVSSCLMSLPSKECCSDKSPICPCFRKLQIAKKPIVSGLVWAQGLSQVTAKLHWTIHNQGQVENMIIVRVLISLEHSLQLSPSEQFFSEKKSVLIFYSPCLLKTSFLLSPNDDASFLKCWSCVPIKLGQKGRLR